jgi:mono/diheme cytochrome c family protein
VGSRVLLLLLAGLVSGVLRAETGADPDLLERGRYLVHAGGCITCHTADEPGAVPLAGGRAIASPYGTFWSPNITPDPETGIGRFTVADVVRALKSGVSPDGQPYYPAFPYPSYAGMTAADAEAIGAYLLSLEPVRNSRRNHELPWYLGSRLVMHVWNFLNFRPGSFAPDPARDAAWNRGAYLVRHLGHCGECHTPRNWLGAMDTSRELAGAVSTDERIPNITPHREDGIGRWTREDLLLFLEIGMLPDGDFAGSSMSAVIDENTARLNPADREAIATYLLSLPPIPAR